MVYSIADVYKVYTKYHAKVRGHFKTVDSQSIQILGEQNLTHKDQIPGNSTVNSSWLLEVYNGDIDQNKLLFKLPKHYWQMIKAIRESTGIFEEYLSNSIDYQLERSNCKVLGFCILPSKISIMIENCKEISIDEYVVRFSRYLKEIMPNKATDIVIDKKLISTNISSVSAIKELVLYPLHLGKQPRYYLYSVLHYYLGGYGEEWLDFRLLEQIEADEL